jgi:hypothetical protein
VAAQAAPAPGGGEHNSGSVGGGGDGGGDDDVQFWIEWEARRHVRTAASSGAQCIAPTAAVALGEAAAATELLQTAAWVVCQERYDRMRAQAGAENARHEAAATAMHATQTVKRASCVAGTQTPNQVPTHACSTQTACTRSYARPTQTVAAETERGAALPPEAATRTTVTQTEGWRAEVDGDNNGDEGEGRGCWVVGEEGRLRRELTLEREAQQGALRAAERRRREEVASLSSTLHEVRQALESERGRTAELEVHARRSAETRQPPETGEVGWVSGDDAVGQAEGDGEGAGGGEEGLLGTVSSAARTQQLVLRAHRRLLATAARNGRADLLALQAHHEAQLGARERERARAQDVSVPNRRPLTTIPARQLTRVGCLGSRYITPPCPCHEHETEDDTAPARRRAQSCRGVWTRRRRRWQRRAPRWRRRRRG